MISTKSARGLQRTARRQHRRELEKIEHVIKQLGRFPGLSRPGRAKGTWESVVAGTSYIIVFELWERPAAVVVTGVIHGARNRERRLNIRRIA